MERVNKDFSKESNGTLYHLSKLIIFKRWYVVIERHSMILNILRSVDSKSNTHIGNNLKSIWMWNFKGNRKELLQKKHYQW